MSFNKTYLNVILCLVFIILFGIINVPITHCQQWTALPPYNTLWPLWSPALSPLDPDTNLLTPIVTNLSPSTFLPVQPGLTWDPDLPYPFLLYNSPGFFGAPLDVVS